MAMPSEEFKENVRNTFKESLLILVYEFMGTALMTTLFINTSKCRNLKLRAQLILFVFGN